VRPGRADRFGAKKEGEKDLVSPGMIVAGCRRPDGLWFFGGGFRTTLT